MMRIIQKKRAGYSQALKSRLFLYQLKFLIEDEIERLENIDIKRNKKKKS